MFGISYWILPIFAGTVWLGTLLGMLAYWVADGSPHYSSMGPNQQVAFISDIGATFLKPLFIAGSATMVAVFDFTFIVERWFRHKNRLAPNYSRKEAFLNVCAMLAAVVGGAGLILLTIFDTRHYPKMHDAFLGIFIIGYIVSAIFICAEYQRLGIHYREHRVLRISFWVKMAFIFLELLLVIGFGVAGKYGKENLAGYFEWIVSLFFIFYVWSFTLDFLPATHTKRPENRFPNVRDTQDRNPERTQENGNMVGGPVYSGHNMTQYQSYYQADRTSR